MKITVLSLGFLLLLGCTATENTEQPDTGVQTETGVQNKTGSNNTTENNNNLQQEISKDSWKEGELIVTKDFNTWVDLKEVFSDDAEMRFSIYVRGMGINSGEGYIQVSVPDATTAVEYTATSEGGNSGITGLRGNFSYSEKELTVKVIEAGNGNAKVGLYDEQENEISVAEVKEGDNLSEKFEVNYIKPLLTDLFVGKIDEGKAELVKALETGNLTAGKQTLTVKEGESFQTEKKGEGKYSIKVNKVQAIDDPKKFNNYKVTVSLYSR